MFGWMSFWLPLKHPKKETLKKSRPVLAGSVGNPQEGAERSETKWSSEMLEPGWLTVAQSGLIAKGPDLRLSQSMIFPRSLKSTSAGNEFQRSRWQTSLVGKCRKWLIQTQ